MSRKKILIIVEGEKTEKKIIGKLEKGLLPFANVGGYELIAIGNPIYELYEKYKRDEYNDIVEYLRGEGKLDKLSEDELSKTAFSAIYLVFDFEPHYQKYSFKKIKQMQRMFNNETELGKLYINYPMVEACFHINNIPDPKYNRRNVRIKNSYNGKYYKRKVADERCKIMEYYNDKLAIREMLLHCYNKAKTMDGLPYKRDVNHMNILKRQAFMLAVSKRVAVLGTLPLILLDYNFELALEQYDLMYRVLPIGGAKIMHKK